MTLQAANPRLILASASTARANLLRAARLTFDIFPSSIDEAEVKRQGLPPEATALRLAKLKAQQIARLQPDALVIGSDQILVCDDRSFDKPTDLADARTQLLALRGRSHMLVTAVTCHQADRNLWHHVEKPRLTMRPFSETFLADYLAMEAAVVTTTVGGYRLEGPGIHLFDAVDGEQAAILGLPMLALLAFLRLHGVLSA
jgi:septum formation protein